MNRNIRDIAIRRLNIIPIGSMLESSRGVFNPASKAAFITQLAQLGYRVENPQAYIDAVLSHFDGDIKVLEKMRGDDVVYVPLFSGFPNEVPNQDFHLTKRILGLIGNWAGLFDESDGRVMESGLVVPDWMFDLDEFGADPILGRQDATLFEKGVADQNSRESDTHVEWIDLYFATEEETEVELRKWVSECLYSNSSIKTALKSDLEGLLLEFGVDYIDASNVSFKETKTYLTNFLWSVSENYVAAADCMDNPTDVLRLMAALTETDVSLATPIKFPKLNRAQRRAVLSVIERSSNPVEDLNRYRDLWIAFGRGLHPGEYQDRYPRTAEAFKSLRSEKSQSFESKVNQALNAHDIVQVANLLKIRPAVFGRRLHHVLEVATAGIILGGKDAWSYVLDQFEQVAHQIPIKNLITLQAYFRTIEGLDYRTTVNKKGKLRVYANKKGRITKACNARLNDILSAAIDRAMQDKESWRGQKVYIDETIRNYVVPLAQRTATDGLMTLARGSRIDIDTSKVVRLFIYWKEAERRTDLDLSCVAYDKDMNYVGHVSYTNLSSGDIVHSGDITSAPYGASEFIDIPIAKVKKNMKNVRYLAAQTYIFSGENFYDLKESYGGWMIRDKTDRSQKSFDIKTVQSKFDVRGKGRYTIPCLLDLETNQIIYVDLYMSGVGSFNGVEGAVSDVGIVTREVARMYDTKPNMLDLAIANAVGRNAEIVTDPEEADITFGFSGCTYNVTDIETILSELV